MNLERITIEFRIETRSEEEEFTKIFENTLESKVSKIPGFGLTEQLVQYIAIAVNAGALLSLHNFLKLYFERHKSKKVNIKIDNTTYEFLGYSSTEIEKLKEIINPSNPSKDV